MTTQPNHNYHTQEQARAPPHEDGTLGHLAKQVQAGSEPAFAELLDRQDVQTILTTRSRDASGYRAVITPREVHQTGPSLIWSIIAGPNCKLSALSDESQQQAYLSQALKNQYQKLVQTWGALTYTTDWKLTPKFTGVNLDDVSHTLAFHHTPEDVVIARDTIKRTWKALASSPLPKDVQDALLTYVSCGQAKTAADELGISTNRLCAYVRQARAYLTANVPDLD